MAVFPIGPGPRIRPSNKAQIADLSGIASQFAQLAMAERAAKQKAATSGLGKHGKDIVKAYDKFTGIEVHSPVQQAIIDNAKNEELFTAEAIGPLIDPSTGGTAMDLYEVNTRGSRFKGREDIQKVTRDVTHANKFADHVFDPKNFNNYLQNSAQLAWKEYESTGDASKLRPENFIRYDLNTFVDSFKDFYKESPFEKGLDSEGLYKTKGKRRELVLSDEQIMDAINNAALINPSLTATLNEMGSTSKDLFDVIKNRYPSVEISDEIGKDAHEVKRVEKKEEKDARIGQIRDIYKETYDKDVRSQDEFEDYVEDMLAADEGYNDAQIAEGYEKGLSTAAMKKRFGDINEVESLDDEEFLDEVSKILGRDLTNVEKDFVAANRAGYWPEHMAEAVKDDLTKGELEGMYGKKGSKTTDETGTTVDHYKQFTPEQRRLIKPLDDLLKEDGESIVKGHEADWLMKAFKDEERGNSDINETYKYFKKWRRGKDTVYERGGGKGRKISELEDFTEGTMNKFLDYGNVKGFENNGKQRYSEVTVNDDGSVVYRTNSPKQLMEHFGGGQKFKLEEKGGFYEWLGMREDISKVSDPKYGEVYEIKLYKKGAKREKLKVKAREDHWPNQEVYVRSMQDLSQMGFGANQLVNTAFKYKDVDYPKDMKNPKEGEMTCSNLTCAVLSDMGVPVAGTSRDLYEDVDQKIVYKSTDDVSNHSFKDGDLIFFDRGPKTYDGGQPGAIDHVGIVAVNENGEPFIIESASGKNGFSMMPLRARLEEMRDEIKKIAVGRFNKIAQQTTALPKKEEQLPSTSDKIKVPEHLLRPTKKKPADPFAPKHEGI